MRRAAFAPFVLSPPLSFIPGGVSLTPEGRDGGRSGALPILALPAEKRAIGGTLEKVVVAGSGAQVIS